MGLRYRVSARPLPHLARTADLVFRPSRVAVFVDGCFWHSCPQHGSTPRANSEFWRSKLARTVERDRETNRELDAAGWLVLRFWEHDDPNRAAAAIRDAVNRRRPNRSTG
jgi:DNA mismatch endonuclease (patch repair protein)